MDLHAKPYRCFLAIAEHGSFARAAEAANMSQPALSALIKEFERRLGFALFARRASFSSATPGASSPRPISSIAPPPTSWRTSS